MNELNELHDVAYENSLIYKEKTKKIHDSKIKNRIFNVGDRVLLFNSRLKISLMAPLSYLQLTGQTSRIAQDYEDSRAHGFVHHPLDLRMLILESDIRDLIDLTFIY
ncbi:hypothetical protein Tco_1534985 [Tanacetum coccineum]